MDVNAVFPVSQFKMTLGQDKTVIFPTYSKYPHKSNLDKLLKKTNVRIKYLCITSVCYNTHKFINRNRQIISYGQFTLSISENQHYVHQTLFKFSGERNVDVNTVFPVSQFKMTLGQDKTVIFPTSSKYPHKSNLDKLLKKTNVRIKYLHFTSVCCNTHKFIQRLSLKRL